MNECGQQHPLAWGLRLNKMDKNEGVGCAPGFISLSCLVCPIQESLDYPYGEPLLLFHFPFAMPTLP